MNDQLRSYADSFGGLEHPLVLDALARPTGGLPIEDLGFGLVNISESRLRGRDGHVRDR